jgi:hypothetical protein
MASAMKHREAAVRIADIMVGVPMLWFSLAASIVLTVVLNLVLLFFPGAGRRFFDGLAGLREGAPDTPEQDSPRGRTRVIFPWKAMLIGSVILTVLINLFVLVRR